MMTEEKTDTLYAGHTRPFILYNFISSSIPSYVWTITITWWFQDNAMFLTGCPLAQGNPSAWNVCFCNFQVHSSLSLSQFEIFFSHLKIDLGTFFHTGLQLYAFIIPAITLSYPSHITLIFFMLFFSIIRSLRAESMPFYL